MAAILKTDHEYHLETEAIEPVRERCAECGELGPMDLLFRFVTVRGARRREHQGLFCSTDCHDRFYGLRPR